MRAVVYDRYGSPEVLRLEELPKPEPKAGEVLVRVRAGTVNRFDCHTWEANRSNGPLVSGISRLVSGVRAPRRRVLGSEFAGEVEAIGPGVTEFKAGDRVFGNTGLAFGCHAEYVCVRESSHVALMSSAMSFEEAAPMTDGALNALGCLRPLLSPGSDVLVYGASGAIGRAGVQLARHFGARVTAVCNTRNLELARSLGAERVIDYTKEDFTQTGALYDVIFDAVGKNSFARSKRALKTGGGYVATDGLENLWLGVWTRFVGDKRVRFQIPPVWPREDLALLRDLFEVGECRPVIDRRFPLEDVIEAARYVETQQKTGNVVLLV